MDSDDCDEENGVCTNTDGSFNCSCKVGYTGDGRDCIGMYTISIVFSNVYVLLYVCTWNLYLASMHMSL